MAKSNKYFTVRPNFNEIITLDGEKYGISLPTKSIMEKLETIMLADHRSELLSMNAVPDDPDEAVRMESYSCRSGYIDNIRTTAGEIEFDIFDDYDLFGEEKNAPLAAVMREGCKYSLQISKRGGYLDDISWRPVLVPLNKDGERDLLCAEPDGTIVKGQTLFLVAETGERFPVGPQEKYSQEVPYKDYCLGDTLPSPELQLSWMWVDKVLVLMYTLGEENIRTLAQKGHLFNRYLLPV